MSATKSRLDRAPAVALLGPMERVTLITAATLAPSLHNSQPWAFAVDADHVEVYADAARQLPMADPAGRALHVSCGAALFNLRVAAEQLGFHSRTRLLPRPDDPTLMAIATVDHRHARTGSLAPLYPAVAARRTNRYPFRDRPVPATVIGRLSEAVRAEGALLRVYDDPDEVGRLVGLLHDAELAERLDVGRVRERRTWVATGIPAGSVGPLPVGRNAPYRDVADRDHGQRAEFEAAPTVTVLSTVHDEPRDWIRAGQALERMLLQATLDGVSASFLNQPIEDDVLRTVVGSPTHGIGHAQMIARIGYGPPVPATPRRALTEVIRPVRYGDER